MGKNTLILTFLKWPQKSLKSPLFAHLAETNKSINRHIN